MTAFAAMLCFAVAVLPLRPAGAQALADLARASRVTGDGLFGSIELEAGSLQGLPQWTRVLERMEADREAFDRCAADPAYCPTPILKNWRRIITSAANLNRPEQLKAVNDFFNRWPYKQDRELYGLSEYWATPREFMTRSGDCEDYSIAKYFALRKLGFRTDEMRIVILMDRIRGIGHAVLAIYVENDILILDSLSSLILSHARYKHYIPQYSMNESTRWAHIGGQRKRATPPYRGLLARQ
ncbi:MAG: transglutaminase-like cysteine peptidase [Kiloniellaceae bacterium]